MKALIVMMCVLISACAADVIVKEQTMTDANDSKQRLLYQYELSQQCQGCHADQYRQYETSMHAKSFSNPLFNTMYFRQIVPKAIGNKELTKEARRCIACHAPTVFMNYTGLVVKPEQAEKYEAAVSCDFCHTLAGYAENGDYLQNPSGKKHGPLQESRAASHHSEYSGYLQVADFCGRCHSESTHADNATTTLSEWSESPYGRRNFPCQECHMSKEGFLRDGKAEYENGQAAYINIGGMGQRQKDHEKLYSHNFPGAHSASQLKDALQLEFLIGRRSADTDGRYNFTVSVNNERSGHKMPSGSTRLRFMWLDVSAIGEGGRVLQVLPRQSRNNGTIDYSIAGSAPLDEEILGNDVPKGSRIYRVVHFNDGGTVTRTEKIFDNRLNAAEIRKEEYYLAVPQGFSGRVHLSATLYYQAAPSSFTAGMNVPDYKAVAVAKEERDISIVATR